MHKDGEQQDDRQRNADKPEQQTASKTHDQLPALVGCLTANPRSGSMGSSHSCD